MKNLVFNSYKYFIWNIIFLVFIKILIIILKKNTWKLFLYVSIILKKLKIEIKKYSILKIYFLYFLLARIEKYHYEENNKL